MKSTVKVITFLAALPILSFGQPNLRLYEGGWIGKWESSRNFVMKLEVVRSAGTEYTLQFTTGKSSKSTPLNVLPDKSFVGNIDSTLKFEGYLDEGRNAISGFVHSGKQLTHVQLENHGNGIFSGAWNILIVDNIAPGFFVSIEEDNNSLQAYGFFEDHRFPGMWCFGLQQHDDVITFRDLRTGLRFSGKLLPDRIQLEASLGTMSVSKIELSRIPSWRPKIPQGATAFTANAPPQLYDGWRTSPLAAAQLDAGILQVLVDSINAGALTNTHSVLIARGGKLVYEQYFQGYTASTLHDMRSASKSISSAIVGIAVSKGLVQTVDQPAFALLPPKYREVRNNDERKSRITIRHLLTMSSGLDAIDYGTDKGSLAAEDTYQQTEDWIRSVVDAPMIYEPGTHANYGSANPFLLGVILNEQVKQPMSLSMDNWLLRPLGILQYIIFSDSFDDPYFAGGMFMTPRDMLKFGQLYLDSGTWEHDNLVPADWVKQSFTKHTVLENSKNKNEYGYLWWRQSYNVGKSRVQSFEARGAGGQYIFVIPQYDLVAVITSGNFRNGRYWQPEHIMEKYILSAIKN